MSKNGTMKTANINEFSETEKHAVLNGGALPEDKVTEIAAKEPTKKAAKNNKPKDKFGFTEVSYLTCSIRDLTRAMDLNPELRTPEIIAMQSSITELRDKLKGSVTKIKTKAEIEAEIAKLQKRLENAPA